VSNQFSIADNSVAVNQVFCGDLQYQMFMFLKNIFAKHIMKNSYTLTSCDV
jgi:menaquinone-dependent protoporphyrinogen IX oxidase